MPRIRHGLVLACLGDAGRFTYKRAGAATPTIDRAAAHVLRHARRPRGRATSRPTATTSGSTARPASTCRSAGCRARRTAASPSTTPRPTTSSFVQPAQLADSLAACLAILDVLEDDRTYVNQNPKCEPQLGKRGLYRAIGGLAHSPASEMAMLWVLNLSDGQHSLLDIAERSGLPFEVVRAPPSCCASPACSRKRSGDATVRKEPLNAVYLDRRCRTTRGVGLTTAALPLSPRRLARAGAARAPADGGREHPRGARARARSCLAEPRSSATRCPGRAMHSGSPRSLRGRTRRGRGRATGVHTASRVSDDRDCAGSSCGAVKPDVIFTWRSDQTARRAGVRPADITQPADQHRESPDARSAPAAAAGSCSSGRSRSRRQPAEAATPTSPYGAAKWAAGAYARMFYGSTAPVVSVRPFMTYGPGQAVDKLIPSTILSLLRREPPRLSSARRRARLDLRRRRHRGLLRAATARGVEGRTIDLGSGSAIPGPRRGRRASSRSSIHRSPRSSAPCRTGRAATCGSPISTPRAPCSAGGRRRRWRRGCAGRSPGIESTTSNAYASAGGAARRRR